MVPEPRPRAERRRDTELRLNHDVDLWVASASADGAPYLVPLSFDWDGGALLVATPTDSPTGRNLAATRTVRLGLGHRDRRAAAGARRPVRRAHRLRPARGGRAVSLVPRLAAPHPGLA